MGTLRRTAVRAARTLAVAILVGVARPRPRHRLLRAPARAAGGLLRRRRPARPVRAAPDLGRRLVHARRRARLPPRSGPPERPGVLPALPDPDRGGRAAGAVVGGRGRAPLERRLRRRAHRGLPARAGAPAGARRL